MLVVRTREASSKRPFSLLVESRMERERGDLAEDLGREVPEWRQAAATAAIILGREHRGELV